VSRFDFLSVICKKNFLMNRVQHIGRIFLSPIIMKDFNAVFTISGISHLS